MKANMGLYMMLLGLIGRIGQGIERYSARRLVNAVGSYSAQIEKSFRRTEMLRKQWKQKQSGK